jgi:hypothetical protein
VPPTKGPTAWTVLGRPVTAISSHLVPIDSALLDTRWVDPPEADPAGSGWRLVGTADDGGRLWARFGTTPDEEDDW